MPITYTGAPDILLQLKEIFRRSLPPDIGRTTEVTAMAECLMLAEGYSASMVRESRVGTADGAYLALHAKSVGLFKQAGETDDALRERIRTPPDAVTPDLILAAVQQIINANGGGKAYLEELPQDACYSSRKMFANRGWYVGDKHRHTVIVLIPQSSGAMTAVQDALRAKVLAKTRYIVRYYA